MKVDVKLVGDWKRMAAALDPTRFKSNLDSNLRRATKFNGMMVVAEIRKRIRQKRYAKNSALTVLLKKSSTPLINDGDLWGAITSQDVNEYSVFVGILRTTTSSDGQSMANIAELLHDGGSIPVTDAMRGLFQVLFEVGQGERELSSLTGRAAEMARSLGSRISQIKPFRPDTRYIVIPPRPFLREVLKDPAIHKRCEKNWKKALQAAMSDQASGSTSK